MSTSCLLLDRNYVSNSVWRPQQTSSYRIFINLLGGGDLFYSSRRVNSGLERRSTVAQGYKCSKWWSVCPAVWVYPSPHRTRWDILVVLASPVHWSSEIPHSVRHLTPLNFSLSSSILKDQTWQLCWMLRHFPTHYFLSAKHSCSIFLTQESQICVALLFISDTAPGNQFN